MNFKMSRSGIGETTIATIYPSGKVTLQDRLPSGLGTRGPIVSDYWTSTIRKEMSASGDTSNIVAIRLMSKIGFHTV